MSDFKPTFPIDSLPCKYNWLEDKMRKLDKNQPNLVYPEMDRIMYFNCIHKAASYVEGLVGGGIVNVKIEHNLSMAVAGEWQVTWNANKG